jgi:hypothetical protein
MPVVPDADDPRMKMLPEHLRGLAPFMLFWLQDGPRDARFLGWHHAGLQACADAGLLTIDARLNGDDPFVVRLPGDTRVWPGWKKLAAIRRGDS